MLKKLLALLVITSFISNITFKNVNAEGAFQAGQFPYKQMQIQVMPEFDYPEKWQKDQPSLLVGQYGTIVNKSGNDFDGKIEIKVPTKEKSFQVYLVAEFPSESKPEVQRPYDVDKANGIISWKPKSPIKNNETYKFVVEYYSNPIAMKDTKSFAYHFTPPADIDQLDVIFYAPINAKNIKFDPQPQNTSKSEYGEDIYYYSYKNVKKDNRVNYRMSYKKDGTESTLAAIDKKQPPKDENHTGVNGGNTATDQVLNNSGNGESSEVKQPIIGIPGALIIGVSLIIAGAFVFLGLKGSRTQAKAASKNKKGQKKQVVRKESRLSNAEEKKELRKKLLNGKIDQETYEEEMKKLI